MHNIYCDAEMSQKAFTTKNDDTFTEQQTRRWRRNEAGRRRRYGRQTQERPVTFQLNNKMLKSRGLKSSRALQSEGAGSSHSGSRRNCVAHGNKTEENGGQSSAVRDILLYIQTIWSFLHFYMR